MTRTNERVIVDAERRDRMKKIDVLNNYKGVIIFYIIITILSVLLVMNNNRINKLNNLDTKNIVNVSLR